jgi:hypothetical protein
VLPGVFEVTELITGAIERWVPAGMIRGRPFRVTRRNLALQLGLGVAMLVLPLAWPEDFFPLIWGFAFLLLDPLCYALGGRSLLGRLASGDNTRLVALLASGFLCGGLWEAWNISARTKWIYTVPFFDELKLFEMPVLGFLGFPPFVLECYAIVNAVSLLRGGRHWELSADENRKRTGIRPLRALAGWILCLLGCFPVVAGLLTWTVLTFSIPLDTFFEEKLSPEAKDFLRREGARHTHQYLELGDRPEPIPPALHREIRRLSTIAEIKGIGLVHARALSRLGVRTPEQLAECDAGALTRQLNHELNGWWRVRPAEVKVWVSAARARVDRTRPTSTQ